MNNTTLPQESAAPLDSPGFMAYAILLTVTVLVGGLTIVLTTVPLAMAQSIPRPARLFLINLLLAGLLVAAAALPAVVTFVVLVTVDADQPRPPEYLCRVYSWLFIIGAMARLWSLAAFSLSILAIVRFGKKTISKRYAAVFITIIWIVPIVMTMYVMFPHVFEQQYVNGVVCFPDNKKAIFVQTHYTVFAIWALFGGIIPLTVSIAVPIVCLCYIKKNIVTEEVQFRKGLAKFSLFLVLGGAIGIAGGAIPVAVSFSSEASEVCLTYGLICFSLFPTPIIIIAYLKSVQEQIKRMVGCARLIKQ